MIDNSILQNITFSVTLSRFLKVGTEWNMDWNKDLYQFQCNRLYYLKKGKGLLYLHNRVLTLEPGYVYLIPAFGVLRSELIEEMEKYFIHFQTNSSLFYLYDRFDSQACYPADELTEGLFRLVLDNYMSPPPASYFKVQGSMQILLSGFFNHIDTSRQNIMRFVPIVDYLQNNYRQDISIKDLAAQMNLNPVYFSDLFKSTFHISPKQYLINKRLIESQNLLLETSLSVKEIAYEVGFSNENYFSEIFKQKIGVSPTHFRQAQKNSISPAGTTLF